MPRWPIPSRGFMLADHSKEAHPEAPRVSRVRPATVTGSVSRVDGSPAGSVEVSLWWTSKRGYERRTYPIKTDTAGRFQIPAWQGIRYWLEVGPHGDPSAQIAITTLNEPFTITLADR
jgi:hypothetical protein